MSIATTVVLGIFGLLAGAIVGRGGAYVFARIRRSGRLIGLTLISLYEWCIAIFLSLLAVPATVSIALNYEELRAKWAAFQITPAQLLAEMFIIITLAYTAAFGLWRATAWGWDVAVFAISVATARNLAVLIFSRHLAPQLGQPTPFYIAQHVIRILVGLLFLIYLFRPKVMHYCGIHETRVERVKKLTAGLLSGFAVQWLLQRLN
jgi:hypothetical protein